MDRIKQHNFLKHVVEYQPNAAKFANKKHEGQVFSGPIESHSS